MFGFLKKRSKGPVVYERAKHCISRKDIDPDALKVLYRLNALGYSHKSGWKLIENMNSLKKGDILFFRSDKDKSVNHTGIYLGGGTMIDASSGHGRVVKRAISPYFKRNFVCARRPWRD